MKWISSWAEQIIVAVIIATIIEMILPNGNNKKYIKTVIGVYVLFTIISPVITNVLGKDVSLDTFSYEEYFKNSNSYSQLSESFSNSTNSNIESAYVVNLEQDIKNKLKQKGYSASNIQLEIELEDEEMYGSIKHIKINIKQIEEKEEEKNNTVSNTTINEVSVNKIQVGNNTNRVSTNTVDSKTLTSTQTKEIKEFLNEEYGVDKEQITIL